MPAASVAANRVLLISPVRIKVRISICALRVRVVKVSPFFFDNDLDASVVNIAQGNQPAVRAGSACMFFTRRQLLQRLGGFVVA